LDKLELNYNNNRFEMKMNIEHLMEEEPLPHILKEEWWNKIRTFVDDHSNCTGCTHFNILKQDLMMTLKKFGTRRQYFTSIIKINDQFVL